MEICFLTDFIENCSPYGELLGFGVVTIESDLWRALLLT
jgi:hypothetical protein